MDSASNVIFTSFFSIRFVNNIASKLGGAIYYDLDSVSYCDSVQKLDNQCFISFLNPLRNASLKFENNSAGLDVKKDF